MVVLCYLPQLTLTRWDYLGGPNLITGFLKSREFWILRWARNEECRKHQRLKPILCQPARKRGPQTHSHRNWNLSTTWMILEVILSQHLQIRAELDSIIFFCKKEDAAQSSRISDLKDCDIKELFQATLFVVVCYTERENSVLGSTSSNITTPPP